MFGSSKQQPNQRYAVVVDVASASVGIAIVHSTDDAKAPAIVWSHRELVPVRKDITADHAENAIIKAAINAFVALSGSGVLALRSNDPGAVITDVFTMYGAPWAATASMSVRYDSDKSFSITQSVLNELELEARKKAQVIIAENEVLDLSKVTIIDQGILEVTANGYLLHDPLGKEASAVTLDYLLGVVDTTVLNAVTEAADRVLPEVEVQAHTFMYSFYAAQKLATIHNRQVCLLDVSGETTEVGIVRDGVFTFSSFTDQGMNSIAREIARELSVPIAEAAGYMRSEITSLPPLQRQTVQTLVERYEDKVLALMAKTGDTLTIPKDVFLHAPRHTETFFVNRIKSVLKKLGCKKATVKPINQDYFPGISHNDSTLSLAGYVFHKKALERGHMDT